MAKITLLKQKLHSGRHIKKNYPRVERENKDFSPEYISDEMASFYPPQSADYICEVVKESPFEHYLLSKEIDLQDSIPFFNSILLYRILKLLYDQPDILGAIISNITETNSKRNIQFLLDWGYVIRIKDEDVFGEIRSTHNNTRYKLRYWTRAFPQDLSQNTMFEKIMYDFFEAFSECFEKNTHLFEERNELSKITEPASAFSNIFAERYNSATQLLEIAINNEKLPEKRDVGWEEKVEVSTENSLYLSSAILYIIALEALINTIYRLLLRPEFSHVSFERATIRANLDVRIISMHLFCEGFLKPIIAPETELWSHLLKLRQFRNDVIHGNITSDHYIHGIKEDYFIFTYGKNRDFPGRKELIKANNNYPTHLSRINFDVVSEIKKTVDQIIIAIMEAADQDINRWISSWLFEAAVMNLKNRDIQLSVVPNN